MDNFAGVSALMAAYFSAQLSSTRVHCKVTYGEEKAINGVFYAGALEVAKELKADDFVAVIDVTGVSARAVNSENVRNSPKVKGHVCIEKVRRNPVTRTLLRYVSGCMIAEDGQPVPGLSQQVIDRAPYTYETYTFCDDQQADADESDAYRRTVSGVNAVFLGLPTCGGDYGRYQSGGDYNIEPVFCWQRDIEAMTLLIIDLSAAFVEHYDEIITGR